MSQLGAVRTELDLATDAATVLSQHGQTSLAYITAEFAPFSSSTKPDIIFYPAAGPSVGRVIFVELRMYRQKPMRPDYIRLLPEHQSFVAESSELPIRFVFATDEDIESDLKSYLRKNGVEFLGRINSGQQLARIIIDLSQIPDANRDA